MQGEHEPHKQEERTSSEMNVCTKLFTYFRPQEANHMSNYCEHNPLFFCLQKQCYFRKLVDISVHSLVIFSFDFYSFVIVPTFFLVFM